jgi:hypothetical protein
MKTMTWEEIEKDWGGLQKKHRMEIAQAVARYCVGHSMKEVGEKLGYSHQWVLTQLDYAGVSAGIGGPVKKSLTGSTDNVAKELPRLISEFAPDVQVKTQGGKNGAGEVVAIEGKDADAFQPYLDHYVEQGHEPAAAVRLAKAEWAAEEAVNAGVIKEDVNKRNEKVNRILFPDDAKDTFEIDLKMHMARVKAAAKFLDQAKMNYLRRKSTCEMVESANEAWVEQVERVLANHSNHQ